MIKVRLEEEQEYLIVEEVTKEAFSEVSLLTWSIFNVRETRFCFS